MLDRVAISKDSSTEESVAINAARFLSYLTVRKLLEKKNKAKPMWRSILEICIGRTLQILYKFSDGSTQSHTQTCGCVWDVPTQLTWSEVKRKSVGIFLKWVTACNCPEAPLFISQFGDLYNQTGVNKTSWVSKGRHGVFTLRTFLAPFTVYICISIVLHWNLSSYQG